MSSFLDKTGLTHLWDKIKEKLDTKVDKIEGKGLSTNDFTTEEKNRLAVLSASGGEANVQSDWNVTDTTSDAFIKNKPTSLPANGGNADTVGGFTVGANVPASAKFTDTTYPAATTSAAGLMSASDKSKLEGITASADSVVFSASLTSGTQIGTITINGTATKIYAPSDTNTTYSAITTAEIDDIFES